MRVSSKIALCAAAALAATSLTTFHADAQVPASSRTSTDHPVASVGSIHASAAKRVVLKNLPSNGGTAHRSSHATLMKNGKPTGSNLPSRASTGSKTVPSTTSPSGPLLLANGFDGVGLATSSCGCQPPDVNATIGPNHIVEAVNLSLAVYTKLGSQIQNTSLATFLGTTDGLSDPRVLYDPTWNRYSLVLTDTSSPSLWFAFSQTGDPTGVWYIQHAFLPFAAGSIVDYPMVGMDRDAMIYTSNNFDPSGNYINSTSFAVPKALVYNGFDWTASLPGVNINTTPAIIGGYPTQAGAPAYMLSPDATNNAMYVYYWTGTSQTPVLHYKGSIAYSWDAPARRINQPGTATTLDPLDGRIGWAVSQLSGKVWFAHGASIAGFPSVNWGYVKPGGMTIAVGNAFMTSSSDDFNPSIAVMNDGTDTREVLSWAYTDSANSVATKTVYAIHKGFPPEHVSGSAVSLTGGITGETRFGDYSSVAPEYSVNGTCGIGTYALVANQYFSPTDGSWRTRLGRVHQAC